MSALLAADAEPGSRWDAFWSADAYFVRCTRDDASIQWFTVSDDEPAVTPTDDKTPTRSATRVLQFPLRQMQTRVVIAKGPHGRDMLVGTARRVNRRSVGRTGE